MAKQISFEAVQAEYSELWRTMTIRDAKAADINTTAGRILDRKTRYQAVETDTGVPWFVVGVIHAMECGLRFDRHLHCGDPLTARTVHVPKGRPKAPPADGQRYSWLESAVDALEIKNLGAIQDWTVERICYELERFNGWGYRNYHSDVLSPYLWSGTNHYTRGKYVADGKWSSSAVSGQSGAMALIKRLAELDADVALRLQGAPIASTSEVAAAQPDDPADEFRKAEEKTSLLDTSERNFAKVNALAAQGSRLAGALRGFKTWFWNLLFGSAITGGAATMVDQSKGTGAVAAQNPHLLWMLAGVAAGALLIGLAAYLYVKFRVEPGLISAAKDKRYNPKGA